MHAQAYQRSPLDPFPAERISHRRSSLISCRTACAQVSATPRARLSRKLDDTRST
jgi:hypothetical protein